MISINKIKEYSLELGFDECSVVEADRSAYAERFDWWLSEGYQGQMDWLERNKARRLDPREVLSNAKHVITFSVNYFQNDLSPDILNDPSRGIFARYAWFDDYHDIVLDRLERVIEKIQESLGREGARFTFKPYVDTGPVFEREWCARSGLGFVGNNTMLINTGLGSYMFLGVILTDMEVDCKSLHDKTSNRDTCFVSAELTRSARSDSPRAQNKYPCSLWNEKHLISTSRGGRMRGEGEEGRRGGCYECTRCLTACPTGAFVDKKTLDARKCISYLTIENKGAIPEEMRPLIGNRIYGCDICQEVCPWNLTLQKNNFHNSHPSSRQLHSKKSSKYPDTIQSFSNKPDANMNATSKDYFFAESKSYAKKTNSMFDVIEERIAPKLVDLMSLDEEGFREYFKGSPVKRAKRLGLLRNVAVALGNWGSSDALPVLKKALRDEEPLIREHVQWAIKEINNSSNFSPFRQVADEATNSSNKIPNN